jgi:hypothetical protein
MTGRSAVGGYWWLVIALPLLVLSCGEDGAPAPEGDGQNGGAAGAGGESASGGEAGDTAEGTIVGPEGGVVVSDDGLLKLSIPAGALETAIPISITAVGAADSSAALIDATLRGAYRFEPDGTEFAEPATFEYTLDDFVTGDESEAVLPILLVTTESDDTVEVIDEHVLDVNLDTNQVVLSGPLSHFSQMAMNSLEPTALDTMFFYVTIRPKPPRESKLGTDYGVGLFVHTKSVLAREALLTYDDESTNLDYSEGPDPYEIAAFGSSGDTPGLDTVPVGTYGCSAVGSASFSARLTTDPIELVPLLAVGRQGNDKPKSVGGVLPVLPVYDVTIRRDVTCNEAGTNPDPVDGPPYSGLAGYTLHLQERQFDTLVQGAQLNGAFYGGGAAQADFDAWVTRKRALLGITADRLPSGACREVLTSEAWLDAGPPPASTVTHVAAGAADQLAFSFLDTDQAEPALVPWLAPVRGYVTQYATGLVLEPSPSGIDVFVPAAAATPSINLPGWDAVAWQGFASFRGEDGLEITWDAELIQADHVHALIVGYSDAGSKLTECFVEAADQQLLIAQQVINDTFVPALNEEVPTLEIHMYSGRRTGAAYDGRTLEGIVLRDTTLRY